MSGPQQKDAGHDSRPMPIRNQTRQNARAVVAASAPGRSLATKLWRARRAPVSLVPGPCVQPQQIAIGQQAQRVVGAIVLAQLKSAVLQQRPHVLRTDPGPAGIAERERVQAATVGLVAATRHPLQRHQAQIGTE
ncbi:hypothetical protein G6F60_014670 [Rhizopus arrhizus]|nr:hypothetical protein G6F23_014473 [Rhizopus arrhizus]KAG1385898.1 hypothetical protein G6F60_014670 [Rhizopus arrhizus]